MRSTPIHSILTVTILAMIGLINVSCASKPLPDRPVLELANGHANLKIRMAGGGITQFTIPEPPINPLSWRGPWGMQGHFLCLDRWGPPTPAEKAAGMLPHGEAHASKWKLLQFDGKSAEMSVGLPMARMELRRSIRLLPGASCFAVTETLSYLGLTKRPFNIVQHATISPPFMDDETVLDSNAGRGYAERTNAPPPDQISSWPNVLWKGTDVDMRKVGDGKMPTIGHFAIPKKNEIGWITAFSRKAGLVLGYAWLRKDYPWLHTWRSRSDDGKHMARGLEFGTAALHTSFANLETAGTILGLPATARIAPGESQSRSYVGFLLPAPAKASGVKAIALVNRILRVQFDDGTTVDLPIGKELGQKGKTTRNTP